MIRAKINVNGIVQGVGFRPFIHKLVTGYKLCGFVRNSSTGAEIEVEGEESVIDAFVSNIKAQAPTLSLITSIEVSKFPDLKNYDEFKIIKSDGESEVRTLISPDVCVCDECLREMRAPGRRYRYPFINCTNCGPRFTIVEGIPYDRKMTSMSKFKMCPECEAEYLDITNRRYHAEPTGCNACGPMQVFLDSSKNILKGDSIEICKEYLRAGKIVAIKGLGGYHLACRFDDPDIVEELRARKVRDNKPFAIMCRDIEIAKMFCHISSAEARVLSGHRRPIVLLQKKSKAELVRDFGEEDAEFIYRAMNLISENSRIGVMLPYTPVHFMIFEDRSRIAPKHYDDSILNISDDPDENISDGLEALIFTSANISETPIVCDDRAALSELSEIADGYLVNNRKIVTRCDDSVCYVYDGEEYLVRRSRGYVPYPLVMKKELPRVLAYGAEQKASFCLSKGNYVIPSQHIGDLKNLETFENYTSQIDHFKNLFEFTPEIIACDMHPDYLSTHYAEEISARDNVSFIRIQHHHAHMASCMADNELEGEVIGLTWDGVGYGEDGKIWGGEFLVGGYESYRRAGHLRYINLTGGDLATKEIWRIGVSLLLDSGVDPSKYFTFDQIDRVKRQIKLGINTPDSSSMGRLFDGVAAIVGIIHNVTYEGEGAILLESAASEFFQENEEQINNKEQTAKSKEQTLNGKTANIKTDVEFDTKIVNISTTKFKAEKNFKLLNKSYKYDIIREAEMFVLDYRPIIRGIVKDLEGGLEVGIICAKFMNTLIEAAAKICNLISVDTGLDRVVMSGGTFNNMYIMERLPNALIDRHLKPFHHHRVSPGDEGLSLGQLLIASKYV